MGASTSVYANRMGGLVVAGAAATASIGMNNIIKDNAGNTYDALIKSL
jgi:hypothetical protein